MCFDLKRSTVMLTGSRERIVMLENYIPLKYTLLTMESSRAEQYHVSVPFLLQQAAWLYERELSQVRAQMRRVGTGGISGTSTPPPPAAPASVRLNGGLSNHSKPFVIYR